MIDARMNSDLFKFAIPKIVIEGIAHRRGALSARCLASVHQEGVQQAVLVVIQESNAATFGFHQVGVR